MLNMDISLKALLGVRAEGALAKTNLKPVVVKRAVLGCFWSLHSHASFYSSVAAATDVCCHYLCENQDSFIGCSLVASLPTAFTEVFGVTRALLQKFFVSTPSPALPVKCLEHRGASEVALLSSHCFNLAVLAQAWLFNTGGVDLERLCSAGASVGHLHLCCDGGGVLLLLIYEAIRASFLSLD